ncbi:uncharacterized protein LOC119557602 [Drosophila subpulchrella]|uniref:uncharacterized protein LOC119557602 n=1 Tax=Drosophila subpulchrella TaxID=1486046 RepID=UPI0018A15634|nr:uncharacterized protein LOC119557602 [Drosophila subpulchrella]
MSDEQLPHFQPCVSEENNENSCNMTVDRPLSPPPEETVEAMEMVEDPPSLHEPEAPISAPRRSARVANRNTTRSELQDISSDPQTISRTPKRGKVQKPTKPRSAKHVITCRNCGNSHICFPVRTRFFTCAEVDGQLFKVKQISGKLARAPSKKNSSRQV